ncbi:hypothetical protein JOC37_001912 [Desulfohalotomaculum tongense]|uniref:Ig-like domain-containing protein n=1 Tax=Desulforadius tongensis TaxID=1216062 RepID=UPI00195DB365|nr:Ig-like domain-containing protein [Desulforadius tongensis]MBM7855515.1 hypothetical protein [Desulforadius tongensis]
MALHITFKQLRNYALIFITLLTIWLVMGHFIWIEVSRDGHNVQVDYFFLAPMNTGRAMEKFSILSEVPTHKVDYTFQWHSPFHLTLIINEQHYPQGVKYTYCFKKSRALIPPFSVSKTGEILTRVTPKLVSVSPAENAPTLGPVILKFNTPISPISMGKMVICEAQGQFKPVNGDYTRWQFIPDKQLRHQQSYHITVKAGLKSKYGLKTAEDQQVTFTTAPRIKLLSCYPKKGSDSVWLSRTVKLTVNQPVLKAEIKGNCPGKTIVRDNTVLYRPDRVFLPASNYRFNVTITSTYGEVLKTELNFSTTNLGNKKWIEVKAGKPCQVWLMQGKNELQLVDGWFTRELDKLPTVTMYEADRGAGTGVRGTGEKLPWIKLNTDILLHATNHTGKDDHHFLGLPSTYSCILLPADVTEEIYANFPRGFMVIVH